MRMEIRVTGRIECRFSANEVAELRKDVAGTKLSAKITEDRLRERATERLGILASHAHEKRIIIRQDGSSSVFYRMGA